MSVLRKIYIQATDESIEGQADEELFLNRLTVDRARHSDREEYDFRHSPTEFSSSIGPNAELIEERKRSDQSRADERKTSDHVHGKERLNKRLIAEALLTNERTATDTNLTGERTHTDSQSEVNSSLLEEERSSHELTRKALVTRDQFLAIVSHDLKNPLGNIILGSELIRNDLSKKNFVRGGFEISGNHRKECGKHGTHDQRTFWTWSASRTQILFSSQHKQIYVSCFKTASSFSLQ